MIKCTKINDKKQKQTVNKKKGEGNVKEKNYNKQQLRLESK